MNGLQQVDPLYTMMGFKTIVNLSHIQVKV
jgi:hypothetical protein